MRRKVRDTATARSSLPSTSATIGHAPERTSTVTSYRSPIPITSASTVTGSTENPSVSPGTPSIELTIAKPCQWIDVGSVKSFETLTSTMSPTRARTDFPGTPPDYAHVDATAPARSSSIGAARYASLTAAGSSTSGCRSSTSGEELRTASLLPLLRQDASTPTEVAAPRAKSSRRDRWARIVDYVT